MAAVSKQPRGARAKPELFPLYSLVLHHVHDHPVEGIDVLPDEVLEHDECFHQEILKEETRFGEAALPDQKTPRDGGSY